MDKVEAQDNKKLEVHKDRLFNLIFDNQINNGDIISLYLKDGNADELYLCNYGESCSSPGYGLVSYNGEEGWYNITVNGLSSSTNGFNLDQDKVKVDYIKAMQIEVEEHSSTNTTYPLSAEIQTNDFEPENWERWNTFSKEDSLNGQNIEYYYSTDSGVAWTEVPEDNNLSYLEESQIKIKAVINSDGIVTPILKSMEISYTARGACIENWTVSYGQCLTNDTKLKHYLDENECETTEELPEDNNTYVECDYCVPSWVEINNSCQSNNTLTSWFNDSNNCYFLTNLSSDNNIPVNGTYNCTYQAPTPVANPSSSGGGGGGSSSRSLIIEEEVEESGSSLITKSEGSSEIEETSVGQSCQAVIEMELPEKISLLKENSYEGEIVNRGKCLIKNIDLQLSAELESLVEFSPQVIEDLESGKSIKIIVSKKNKAEKRWESFLTGSAVSELATEDVQGMIKVEGQGIGTEFVQELPIEVRTVTREKIVKTVKIVSPPGMLMFFVVLLSLILFRRKREHKIN